MNITLEKIKYNELNNSLVFLYGNDVASRSLPFKKDELAYVEAKRKEDPNALVVLNRLPHKIYVQNFDSEMPNVEALEKLRKAAAHIQALLVEEITNRIYFTGEGIIPEEAVAFLEGFHMANYRFDKYKKKKEQLIEDIVVEQHILEPAVIDENLKLWRRIDTCRDWVNEPVIYLNAPKFADILAAEAKRVGNVKCTVLGQKKIESLGMGGLYDTGGLNIKPDDHMVEMKSDMAGAATMASTLFAAAENHLPVHIMAFLPLTDNRPGRNAYAADDILRMYDGTTVEITNTDAEGRLILADAIAYADQQNPELIIDAATLTGAAVRALGTHVIAAMQQDAEKPFSLLGIVGEQVCERLAPLPFWKEYDELLKSDVADMINCNLHANAGTITAGRFLAHFAHHPYIHLDIAGVAYYGKREHHYGVGASGFGVRLLYAFFQTYEACQQANNQ